MGTKTRQQLVYAALCLTVIAGSFLGYRRAHPEWVLYRRAETLFASGDMVAAAPAYLQAAQRGISLDVDIDRLGNAYLASGDLIHILPAFKAWLAQRPGNLEGRLELAVLLAFDRRYDEALDQIDAALRDRPDWRTALSMKARVLTWAGRLEEAITVYQNMLGNTS